MITKETVLLKKGQKKLIQKTFSINREFTNGMIKVELNYEGNSQEIHFFVRKQD